MTTPSQHSVDELRAEIARILFKLDQQAYQAGQTAKAHANGRVGIAEKAVVQLIEAEKRAYAEWLISYVNTHIGAAKVTNPHQWQQVDIKAGALQRSLNELRSKAGLEEK